MTREERVRGEVREGEPGQRLSYPLVIAMHAKLFPGDVKLEKPEAVDAIMDAIERGLIEVEIP